MTIANRTITLLEPIEGPGSSKDAPTVKIKEVIMRPPRYPDIMMLGEPRAYGRSETGIMFTSEKEDVIEAYINRLVIAPADPALLVQCGLADTIQLKDALFDFFEAARRALQSRQSSGSSSTSAS